MFSKQTKDGVKALIDADGGATDAERRRVMDVMADGGAQVVRFDEAARRLKTCKKVVYELCDAHVLQPVFHNGRHIRRFGVTEESLVRHIMSLAKKTA